MNKDYLLPPSQSLTSKPQLKSKKTFSNVPRSSMILPRRTYLTVPYENTSSNEENEIRQLLDTVPVVPKLPKMPDISKYLNNGKIVNRNKTTNDRISIINNYM